MVANLLIRLSDERSWACEPFAATGAESLRDGCLEAFARLRADWACNGWADIARPRALLVQVCYHGEWCAQPETPVIREPGSVPGANTAWADEDWADAWSRCVRTFEHVHRLGRFTHATARWMGK